jgi:NO-binding membrane sensor protein with MHYT domain
MYHHSHNNFLTILSVLIAMFASYTALDLANSVTAARGKARLIWLGSGSLAMGVGIWSMHFVAMLAFSLPGIPIAYDIFLLVLSVVVAIIASAIALFIVSRWKITTVAYIIGSLAMGAAISGMHYIGIASMRMAAGWKWNYFLVTVSILIAVAASFAALQIAFRLRANLTRKGFWYKIGGGVVMGLAISGMHYTAMAAMTFYPLTTTFALENETLLATSGLAIAVICTTVFILGIALTGSIVDRALAKRQALINARDEFMSIASHELKTPLTSIKLLAEIRQLQIDKGNYAEFTPEKLKDMFARDVRNVERLARVIDEMLDISKISSGKLVMNPEYFDIGELVKEVADRHKTLLENARCQVEIKIDGPLMGHWDRFRVDQVLTNLITNAAKYGAGKPVLIKVEKSGPRTARFLVCDHGSGIAKEDQERIFKRFERASQSRDITGLGLGLYIAKEIVEMHHGKIWVESEAEKGSTFFVDLPQNN